MASVYTCPNDGEVLVLEVLGFNNKAQTASVEQFKCQFCGYSKDKPTAIATLKPMAAETYVPPSKLAAKPQLKDTGRSTK